MLLLGDNDDKSYERKKCKCNMQTNINIILGNSAMRLENYYFFLVFLRSVVDTVKRIQ